MKKILIVIVVTIVALLILIGNLLAQEKPGFLGTWTGTTIIGDGSRVAINVSFDKGEAGYTGLLGLEGMISEWPLKNIVFKDGLLTFEFDLVDDAGGSQLIKIELALDKEKLTGHWFDAEGKSDIIELTLKKVPAAATGPHP
jgi:hypothetical protein